MKNPDKVKQGKKNKANGAAFERKVRADLESKGWIVSRWMNQVEFNSLGKLIPAKHKFCGFGRPMAIGTGFPDFIAFKQFREVKHNESEIQEIKIELFKKMVNDDLSDGFTISYLEDLAYPKIIGVECKSNGYLDKEEKEKCKWLLENKIFSKILIASKGNKRGEIIYKEYGM